MKKWICFSSLLVSALHSSAGLSSGNGGPLVVVAVPEPRAVAVAITLPAEFVTVPLRIISDQKNAALAYEESLQAQEFIAKKVREHGQFRTVPRVVSLTQHKSSFGISSGSWKQPAAASELNLLVPFTQDCDNIFAAGAAAARFIERLHLPGKTSCEMGTLRLAIENPEQYRPKLLNLIATEISRTREGMGTAGSTRIEGLESSVLVRELDDRRVEVFLNYSLSVVVDKRE